jgi:hypothetical protein
VSEREKWINRKVVNMIDEYILLIDEYDDDDDDDEYSDEFRIIVYN